MAVNRDTVSPFEVLSTCLFICLRVIAAARRGVCGVTARVSSIAIHYSAPLARRSKRAAALPLTGQPGIHESLIILSSLSLSAFPLFFLSLLCIYSFSLHLSVFLLGLSFRPVSLSPPQSPPPPSVLSFNHNPPSRILHCTLQIFALHLNIAIQCL